MKACPIAKRVAKKVLSRSKVGMKKYGVGLDRKDFTGTQWLKYLQEELLDAANYIEAELARRERTDRKP